MTVEIPRTNMGFDFFKIQTCTEKAEPLLYRVQFSLVVESTVSRGLRLTTQAYQTRHGSTTLHDTERL